jgi:hypothetical protein
MVRSALFAADAASVARLAGNACGRLRSRRVADQSAGSGPPKPPPLPVVPVAREGSRPTAVPLPVSPAREGSRPVAMPPPLPPIASPGTSPGPAPHRRAHDAGRSARRPLDPGRARDPARHAARRGGARGRLPGAAAGHARRQPGHRQVPPGRRAGPRLAAPVRVHHGRARAGSRAARWRRSCAIASRLTGSGAGQRAVRRRGRRDLRARPRRPTCCTAWGASSGSTSRRRRSCRSWPTTRATPTSRAHGAAAADRARRRRRAAGAGARRSAVPPTIDTLSDPDRAGGRLGGSPVVMLAAARPEMLVRTPGWGEGAVDHERIDLRNLEPDDAEQMFRNLLARVRARARRAGHHSRSS